MLKRLAIQARLFLMGAYLSFVALFSWLRPQTYLTMKIIGPLMYMLFFVHLGRHAAGNDDASFYVTGNALHAAAISGIYGVVQSIDGDRWNGTLIYLFGAPVNRLFLFLGRAFMHILDGVLGVIFALIWGLLVFGLDLSNAGLPALLLTILVATLSTSGLGMVLGCLGLITRNVLFISNLVFASLWIFSGANVPIASLPQWAQVIAQAVPLTRTIAATRSLVAGASFEQIAPLLATEFIIGLAYALAGFVMFRWFETRARRRGTLQAM